MVNVLEPDLLGGIVHNIYDAVIPHTYSVGCGAALHLLHTDGPGIIAQI
jgi:hypothetical protein